MGLRAVVSMLRSLCLGAYRVLRALGFGFGILGLLGLRENGNRNHSRIEEQIQQRNQAPNSSGHGVCKLMVF